MCSIERSLTLTFWLLSRNLHGAMTASLLPFSSDGAGDEKTTETAALEADTTPKNVKSFEQLMTELAEMESRIQQEADQSASVRVIILLKGFDGFI